MPHDDQDILHIAPATELEEERIHTLLRAYNARHWPKDTPSLSLTAQVEGELAGGVVAYLVADTVEVEYLFVQERFRDRGIARALLARVESQAQERGARKILLNTHGSQAPGLYRRLGFQEVATIDDVLGTSWHIFLKRI
ncbi:MAG: GNAT family N-acetyltransferase [Olsenella sp.]|jgi:ribosomal protein S18 acetylase RimI-like enzyme|nr:GNAT family N-acetyltransferase [Olsenella sp.]MCI1289378.1 GNAT family N-acetyltransferase [Olsenella sp.]